MRVFAKVVDVGSFTGAANALDLSLAFVSRAISDLEEHLKARLLNRTTRRLSLTEAGQRYLSRCQQILVLVDEAESEAGKALDQPSGRLRVHSMTTFGQHYIVPLIAKYRDQFPTVDVELTLAQRIPDLVEDAFDSSVVLVKELPDSGYISHRLGSVFSVACASPDYIKRYGSPISVGDLAEHRVLQLTSPPFAEREWIFEAANGFERFVLPKPPFAVNVAEAMAIAVRAGMGIGVLPGLSVLGDLEAGRLVRVLPDYKMQERGAFVLFPSRQFLDAKIRTWINFLRERLPALLDADTEALGR